MRILLLTDNFPPESNAPALRCHAHAKHWVKQGADVTVITCFPNFPAGRLFAGYRQRLWTRETRDGIEVIRVPTIIAQNAGALWRIMDFLSFMVSASVAAIFVRRPDVIIATSPQFFTAVAGWFASVARWRPFVFELRDFWPDSVVAVGAMREGAAIRLIRRLEGFLYARADAIIALTHSFKTRLIERGVGGDKITVVPNGVDLDMISAGEKPRDIVEKFDIAGRFVVSYVGTVGMAHGLGVILDAAAQLITDQPNVRFLIVGSGAERDSIKADAEARHLANILFVDPVPHAEIINYWRSSDVTLVLLKDDPLFRIVIPSKIFEAMAAGIPIIANVQGEARALLSDAGAADLIGPDDGVALANSIRTLVADPERRQRMTRSGVAAAQPYSRPVLAERVLGVLRELKARRASR